MNIEVRYFSKTGNTEKIARAIADTFGVEAKTIDEPFEGPVDLLFLGNSVYQSNVSSEIKKFIKNLNIPVNRVINFGTAATDKTTTKKIRKLFKKKGIPVDEQDLFVKGRYKVCSRGITSVLNIDRPNQDDVEQAKQFAQRIKTQFG